MRWHVVLLFTVLTVAPLGAQRGQDAQLVGRASDASGAPLAGVAVTAESPQHLGGVQQTVTNKEGQYRFGLLSPGTYRVHASLPGFKTTQRSDVVLPPGVTLAVDFDLAVAAIAETVLVEGIVPPMDVRSSASPTLIEQGLLQHLPLDRNVTGYVNLAAGVTRNVAFGGSASANPISLDGASGNEPGWGTPTTPLTRTWIEEIQVVGPGAAAQYGEYTGALLNAVTRSGTNRFAGLGEYWTTRHAWTGNNRGGLPADQAAGFRPLEVLERWEAIAQAGGPLLADHLWFFTGTQRYRNDTRTAAFSTQPRQPNEPKSATGEGRSIGKLTGAVSPRLRLEGFIARNTFEGRALNAGPLVEPDALGMQDRADNIWNVRVHWTAGDRTLVEARHGGNRRQNSEGPPADRRQGPAPHFDQFTGVQSVNSMTFDDTTSRIVTTTASVSHYIEGAGGSNHEIRVGAEYERASTRNASGFPGGRLYYDFDGAPDLVELWDGVTYRGNHDRTTVYAQNTWTLAVPVTVNAGIRIGAYRGFPPYDAAYGTRSIAPRLGVAWDVSGRHETVVRAHYGRYHDPIVSSYYDFLDPLSHAPDITALVVGPEQFVELSRFLPTSGFTIDPDIRPSYVEEYLAGLERALPGRISLRAQYVYRSFEDTVSFIDDATIWAPVQMRDPGPDGRPGSADDGPLLTIYNNTNPGAAVRTMTNPPQAYRHYNAAQLVASKRYADGWAFQASYTWSRTRGNFNNQFSSNAANNDNGVNSVFLNPNRAINNVGRTLLDATHALKAFGTVRLPWWSGWNVSGVYRYESGAPWGRIAVFRAGLRQGSEIVRVEPKTRTTPATHTADARVEKTLRFRSTTLGIFGDIFNVTNRGTARGYVAQSGPRFGTPGGWIDPRTLRIGGRISF